MGWGASAARALAADAGPVDVCLIVEGAYPYVSGGLSTWIDNLIRRHSSLTFTVVSILPHADGREPKYGCPPNRRALHHLYLRELRRERRWLAFGVREAEIFAALETFYRIGGRSALMEVQRRLRP